MRHFFEAKFGKFAHNKDKILLNSLNKIDYS